MAGEMSITLSDEQFSEAFAKFPAEGVVAASYALNDALKVAQADYRRRMAGRFTYRSSSGRAFLERQIKMQFYRKGQPHQASIFMSGPLNDPKHEILSKHEAYERRDKDGGMLVVPIRARPNKGSAVPRRFRIAPLQLRPGPGGLLYSQSQKGVFADRKNIYRAVNLHRKDRSKARVEVLYTFRRVTPNPRGPLGWNQSAAAAAAEWPRIAAFAVMQKAAHLMAKGRAVESDFGPPPGAIQP